MGFFVLSVAVYISEDIFDVVWDRTGAGVPRSRGGGVALLVAFSALGIPALVVLLAAATAIIAVTAAAMPTFTYSAGSVEVPVYDTTTGVHRVYQTSLPTSTFVTTPVPPQQPMTYSAGGTGIAGLTAEQLKVIFPMGAPTTFTEHMAPSPAVISQPAAQVVSATAVPIASQPAAQVVSATAAVVEPAAAATKDAVNSATSAVSSAVASKKKDKSSKKKSTKKKKSAKGACC